MENTSGFLEMWNQYMYYGMLGGMTIGILILLYYEYRVLKIKDYKAKYDYVNLHEIRYFWYSVVSFIIAGGFIFNTVASQLIVQHGPRWFFIRGFVSLCILVVAYFIFHSLIRIYYPKKLARRLDKLRNTPRVSPDGNLMRKLSEDEEDLHLETSQIEEEEIQVVDYDVWIDEKTGFKKIEKYIVNNQAMECPKCGYFTYSIDHEELTKKPTQDESGTIVEHLQCSYCGHKERRQAEVAQLSQNVS